nr:unnamed protein product [Callosobruchus analis]
MWYMRQFQPRSREKALYRIRD